MVSTGHARDRAERQGKSIGLESLLRKNKRYDPTKAKAEKYYQKAKLLRSYHKMLKRETPNSDEPRKQERAMHEADDQEGSENDDDANVSDGSMADEDGSDEGGEICKFYSKGKGCRAGASCQFKHEGESARKISICKFYTSRGGCQKGARCKFLHEGTPQVVPREKPSQQSMMMKIWEQKKAEAEATRLAKEKDLAQKQAETRQRKQERMQKTKNHLRKTSSGQPLMKSIMSNLLSKIVKQNEL